MNDPVSDIIVPATEAVLSAVPKDIEISQQQGQAIQAVVNWFYQPWKRGGPGQVFKLFGAAGTGKTTLAAYIAEELNVNVLYVAYTGKASLVLAKKGCRPVSTIHSAIYKANQNEQTGKWSYVINVERLAGVELVIVDESPMVGKVLGTDLLSVAPKVLALGDPYQLPPVNDEGFFGIGEPDFLLTDIHRQAKDNPIIALSMMVREGNRPKIGTYGSSRVMKARMLDYEMIANHDQTLVGKNDTRKFINDMYRKGSGLKEAYGTLPGPDERLICLRNNRERGFLNGSLWRTVKASEIKHHDVVSAIVPEDEEGQDVNLILTPPEYFTGDEQELDWRIRKDADEFCFAYGITTHKAQGSAWPAVLGLDQSKIFRDDWSKWLYTLITRAEENLTLLV